MAPVKATQHAIDRWRERFPGLDMETEWRLASRSGKKSKRKIAASCKAHAHLMRGRFQGYYYMLSRNGAVFVCAPPETIITVFPYSP